jgi:hypothetical protein
MEKVVAINKYKMSNGHWPRKARQLRGIFFTNSKGLLMGPGTDFGNKTPKSAKNNKSKRRMANASRTMQRRSA